MTAEGALLLTLAIEVSLAMLTVWGLQAAGRLPSVALGRVFGAAVGASLITHPFAWWANHTLPWTFAARAALIEVSVVVVEAALYAGLVPVRALTGLGLSLWVNGASFGLGLVWFYWIRG